MKKKKCFKRIELHSRVQLLDPLMKRKVKGGAPDDKTERPFP